MNNTESDSSSHPVTLNALFYVVYFIYFSHKTIFGIKFIPNFLVFFFFKLFLISLQFVFLVRSCVTYTSIFRTEKNSIRKKVQLK